MTLPAQDIVERLRSEAKDIDSFGFNDGTTDLIREAAGTISRLTADNEALRKDKQQLEKRLAAAYQAKYRCNEDVNFERRRVTALEADVERLTRLLEGRDQFIVNCGLWTDFARSLSDAKTLILGLVKQNYEFRKALETIRDFPTPEASRRTEDGYPEEIVYDEFAYRRIVDSYREFARVALGDSDHD